MKKFLAAAAAALGALALVVGVAAATPNGADTLVTVGSPPTPFPQNKQNEPAVAVNPADPAVGFGPQRGSDGTFSWSNGWRLYYANLTSNVSAVRSETAFKGFEAIAVSRLDSQDYAAAKAGINAAWKAPVIVTKQNAALFSDHEMVSVDDASSSPFFGNVYVCDAAFRSQQASGPEPIVVNASSDGGDT